jgi:hypothetical protein
MPHITYDQCHKSLALFYSIGHGLYHYPFEWGLLLVAKNARFELEDLGLFYLI